VSQVVWHPEADEERQAVPDKGDRASLQTAVDKLIALGDRLPFPHQSAVKGSTVRELRPRAGRSRWRALYSRVGKQFVIAAVGPEAKVDPQGFARAVAAAERRLAETEGD
jgi:hypothetical protein